MEIPISLLVLSLIGAGYIGLVFGSGILGTTDGELDRLKEENRRLRAELNSRLPEWAKDKFIM